MRNKSIRIRLLVAWVAAMGTAAAAGQPPAPEPYAVWTLSEATQVYSGPGREYYVASELPVGTQCEVYQELTGGWLAIRPPEGSFSLISAAAIEPVDGKLARVVRETAPSRVGSQFTNKRDIVHVRLERGELVRLIENPDGDDAAWQRIAPPAGEFRWVRAEDVSREPIEMYLDRRSSSEATSDGAVDLDGAASRGWRTSDEPLDAPPTSVQAVSHDEPAPPVAEPAPEAREPSAANASPVDLSFAQRVDQLEIQLSRRIAGPPNLWVFDDLERTAAQLLSDAATVEQTATVERFATRLQRFSALAARHRTAARYDPAARRKPAPSPPAPTLPGAPDMAAYDAVGVLRPVVSKRGNAPPYALVDDEGRVVTFLTPSPSLNLQPLLGKRVGVSGTRGFLPEYQRRNIQTARVAPLDGVRVR